jgi:hypothetical protein
MRSDRELHFDTDCCMPARSPLPYTVLGRTGHAARPVANWLRPIPSKWRSPLILPPHLMSSYLFRWLLAGLAHRTWLSGYNSRHLRADDSRKACFRFIGSSSICLPTILRQSHGLSPSLIFLCSSFHFKGVSLFDRYGARWLVICASAIYCGSFLALACSTEYGHFYGLFRGRCMSVCNPHSLEFRVLED